MHRDIKPDNILIDANNNIKITDFGISALYKQGYDFLSSGNTRVRRPDYVCPEIIKGQHYDYKCDIFSLGYTMYYIMNFELPAKTFFNEEDQQVKRIPNQKYNKNYNIKLVELINKMYRDNPSERPDTSQALKELELIEENINNNNIYINVNNSFNNEIDDKIISSMNCILQCFVGINNINLVKSMVISQSEKKLINSNDFFPLLFFNFFETIDKMRKNTIDIIEYKNKIKILINQLMSKTKSAEIKDSRPVLLYFHIFLRFKEEFNSLMEWTNELVTSNYIYPIDYPENKYPQFHNGIKDFKMNYRNPLVDIFYFIIIVTQKCPNCNYIYNVYSQISSFLALNNNKNKSIIDDLLGIILAEIA